MTTKATTAQRSTVVGVFPSRPEAERAVAELKRAGFKDDEISLIGKDEKGVTRAEGNKAGAGAATGAAVGAGAAALTSLGITFGVIPVVGPVLALGPLAAALLSAAGGAAAGGLIGALVGLGIPEHEAKYYESELQAGRFLVTVKAGSRYNEAWAILHRLGASNYETAAACATPATGGQTMKLHEEQLHAHKQPVETGEVRVRKEVTTEHKTLDVPVQREEVVVERHPVSGQAASSADIRPGQEVRVPVREEQVRVEKTPVVKEEVTVGKRKVQDTEHVGGTVRKEEVKVEQKGDVDVHTKGTAKDADVRRDKGR
jgi:uncharacterized protein (TIGR02271 family)